VVEGDLDVVGPHGDVGVGVGGIDVELPGHRRVRGNGDARGAVAVAPAHRGRVVVRRAVVAWVGEGSDEDLIQRLVSDGNEGRGTGGERSVQDSQGRGGR